MSMYDKNHYNKKIFKKKKKNRHMYHWITLLYTWNEHNIVSQLYSNIKKLKKK